MILSSCTVEELEEDCECERTEKIAYLDQRKNFAVTKELISRPYPVECQDETYGFQKVDYWTDGYYIVESQFMIDCKN